MKKIKNFLLGVIIYKIFFRDKTYSQLPLSILNARVKLYGGYAGVSVAQEIAKRRSERRHHEVIGVLKDVVILAFSVGLIYLLQYIPIESYYYGLSQELVASLIFFFLLLYVIPKKISKESEVKIGLSYFLVRREEDPYEIGFYLKNLGSRAIKPSEVHCELLFGDEVAIVNPMSDYIVENYTPAYECLLNHVSIKLNDTLFSGQRHLVSEVKTYKNQVRIYYRILTVDKIVPDFSKTSPYLFAQKADATLPDIQEYGDVLISITEDEFHKEHLIQ